MNNTFLQKYGQLKKGKKLNNFKGFLKMHFDLSRIY